MDADEEENIPADPEFGWQLQDRANGYPCTGLLPNGKCKYHKAGQTIHDAGGKPVACKMFPIEANSITNMQACSYTFDENGVRSGTCDGCRGKVEILLADIT